MQFNPNVIKLIHLSPKILHSSRVILFLDKKLKLSLEIFILFQHVWHEIYSAKTEKANECGPEAAQNIFFDKSGYKRTLFLHYCTVQTYRYLLHSGQIVQSTVAPY